MGGEFGQWREWNHDDEPRLAPAASTPLHAGVQRWVRDLNRALPQRAGAARARLRRRRLRVDRLPTTPSNSVLAFLRRGARRRDAGAGGVQLHAGAARTTTGSACRAAGCWREVLNSDARALRRQRRRATSAASTPRRCRAHGRAHSLDADAAAARACSFFKPRVSTIVTAQSRDAGAAAVARVVIENVHAAGRRRPLPGQARASATSVRVEADVFTDGHDALRVRAAVSPRRRDAAGPRSPMAPLGNDRWRGGVRRRRARPLRLHRRGLGRPLPDLAPRLRAPRRRRRHRGSRCRSARELVDAAAAARARRATRERSRDWASALDAAAAMPTALRAIGARRGAGRARRALSRPPPRDRASSRAAGRSSTARARASAPGTSCSRARRAASPARTARSRTCDARLPYIAEMGFDVLYLPPIHPIGRDRAQGPQQRARRRRRTIPAARGRSARARAATRRSIPSSARSSDFRRLVDGGARARHRDRARHRVPVLARPSVGRASIPSGSASGPTARIQYAENPPKKYQDIYPFDFESDGLARRCGTSCASVVRVLDRRRA